MVPEVMGPALPGSTLKEAWDGLIMATMNGVARSSSSCKHVCLLIARDPAVAWNPLENKTPWSSTGGEQESDCLVELGNQRVRCQALTKMLSSED